MVIQTAAAEERERSGSQPRYPYADQQPFRGHEGYQSQPVAQRRSNHVVQRPGTAVRRGDRFNYVESTIKSQIMQDKNSFLAR